MRGLLRAYVERYGTMVLAPRRREPIRFSMLLAILRIAPGTRMGRLVWDPERDHVTRMFIAIMLVLWRTGHRVGEVVRHPSGLLVYLITRADLTWRIAGVYVSDPSLAQLLLLREGDLALLASPASKTDQFGELYAPFPSVLPYHPTQPANAARALAGIERMYPCRGDERRGRPLFATVGGEPFTYGFLDAALRDVLTHVFGAAAASVYSWHSFRIGLACALHAAGCDDAMIQLMVRWLNPASLRLYRRVGAAEQVSWGDRAERVTVDTLQLPNRLQIDNDAAFAALHGELCERTSAVTADRVPPAPAALLAHASARSTGAAAPTTAAVEPPRGSRIEVYWTEDARWFAGTVTSHRADPSTGRRVTRVRYDACGVWQRPRDLGYWHELQCEQWRSLRTLSAVEAGRAVSTPSCDAGDGPPPPGELGSAVDGSEVALPPERCASCHDELEPLPRRVPDEELILPSAQATPHRLVCVRCGVRYCSAVCAHVHYSATHSVDCPLPPFTHAANNAVYDDGVNRCLPVRCVSHRLRRGERDHTAGLTRVWLQLPAHRDPCPRCRRPWNTDPQTVSHLTYADVLITRVRAATPRESARTMRRELPPVTVYARWPTHDGDQPSPDRYSRHPRFT